MTQPFSLHCLGRPALYAPDGRHVRLKTRKHLALLIYLAVEPRVQQNRERLTSLLWDKSPSSDARHSLATALSVLRGKLGREAFEGSRDWIRFVIDDLDVDLDRLERGDVLPTDLIPALDVGGFLEDFDIPDATSFAHWRDNQRARWQPRIRDALSRLMDRCRRTGDFKQIENYADRMLRLDDLSEDGIRAKMEARAFAGDRLEALRTYEAWKSRLAEELDAVPAPLLDGIAVRLRHRGLERQNTSEIAPVPTDHWKDRPFVGRAIEYRRLYEGWEASRVGEPSHFLVLGDSGVGKSTLLNRLSTAAGLEGAAVARAQGHALEQKVPYTAIGTLVDDLVDRPGASCTDPTALADLAQVVIHVRDRFPDLPEVRPMQGEAARIRLAECVERLVVNVAEEQPVILMVDDLHHADDASIAVLHLLMRRLEDHPVMVLLAARTAELAGLPSGQRLTESAERIRLGSMELEALSRAESEELVDTLIPEGEVLPTGTARQALLRSGAGFPMALELLVRDWQAHGDQCLALSLDAMTEHVPRGEVPANAYRQSFERIRRQLDPVARNVLDFAAVLGARLHDPRMYQLADLSLGQVMTGLTQLTARRILRDSGRQLEFINELIRGHAYLAIPSSLRRVLHARIAERLLADDREGREVSGLEIAWHLIRAGRGAEAPSYLLRGAQAAMRHGAPNEAERALGSAMEHLEGAVRSEALVLLAEAFQEQGKFRDSLNVLDGSAEVPSEDLRMRRVVMRTRAHTILNRRVNRTRVITRLISLAKSTEQSVARSRALSFASTLLGSSPNSRTTVEMADALMGLSHQVSSPGELADIAHAQAGLLYMSRDLDGANQTLIRGIEILTSNRINSSILGALYLGQGAVECARGRYGVALEALTNAQVNADRSADGGFAPSVAANLSLCYGRLGRYQEQAEWARRAVSLNAEFDRPDKHFKASYFLAFSHAMTQQHEKASHVLHECNERTDDEIAHSQWWGLRRADILMLLGDKRAALESASDSLEYGMAPTAKAHAGLVARWVATLICESRLDDTNVDEGRDLLHELEHQMSHLDRMDQLEIEAALMKVEGPTRIGTHDSFRRPNVPHSIRAQLQRLGM